MTFEITFRFEIGLKLLRTSWSRFGFLRRGVKTAFLRDEGRKPDTSDKFTILQIDGRSRSKCSFSNVAGKGSRRMISAQQSGQSSIVQDLK